MYYYYIDHFQAKPVDAEASEKYRKYHASHVRDVKEIGQVEIMHLVQSYYAYDYVGHAVDAKDDNILHVSDYIGEKYRLVIGESLPHMDIALYNPEKCLDKIVLLWEKRSWLKWLLLLLGI